MDRDDVIPLITLGVIAIILFRQAVADLRTGRLKWGSATYGRREEPVEYWFYFTFMAILIAILAWQVAEPFRDAKHPEAVPWILFVLIATPAAFALVRGIQTGSTRLWGSTFGRRAAPRKYWTALLAYLALIVAAFGILYFLPRLEGEDTAYGQTVEPVVNAVREELRAKRSLGFRNVRVDGRSRLVCGEVVADRRTHRFYGNAVRGEAIIRLEGEDQGFDPAYRRVCGAPGYVPEH